MGNTISKARIEYTIEDRRGNAVRKAKEVPAKAVDRTIAALEEKGAYQVCVSYEVAS